MKANELRLGNLIKIGGNTIDTYQIYTPKKVTLAILNEIAGENEERPDAELSVFIPIPLTEEWLLKFGFKQDGFYNSAERWVYLNNILFKGNGHYILCHYPLCMIKYVHQLQNLYFALTGEELIRQ